MSEQGESRIADARRRAFGAKRRLALGALAAFAAVFGLAWASHPGSSSKTSSADEGSLGDSSSFAQPDDDGEDDLGGFVPFGGLAPSGSAAPQAQSHVS